MMSGSVGQPDNSSSHSLTASLWWLTIAPVVWAVHLLACYLIEAVYCAKFAEAGGESGIAVIRWIVGAMTVVALAIIVTVGVISFRRHRVGESAVPHDFDSQEDQGRFLGLSAFLLSVLSAIATLYTAAVFVFIGNCY